MTPSNPLNGLGRGFIPRPISNLDNTSFLVSFIRAMEIGNSIYLDDVALSTIFTNFCVQTYEPIKKSAYRQLPPVPLFKFHMGGNNA